MEIFDVVDENDRVVGQASREDCHNNASLIHRAVHFTLVDPVRQQIMISRRSLAKKHDGGKLCFLGEHVLSGEDYSDATRRGVKEELAITATTIHEVSEHVFSGVVFTERIKMFLVEYDTEHQPIPDPDEIAMVEWYTVEQLGSLTVSDMTQYWLDNVDWAQAFLILPNTD